MSMASVQDKVAIVTGGARGIGKSIVTRFFRDGAKVAILDYDFAAATQTANELDPSGEMLFPVGCDVSIKEEVDAAVAAIMQRFARIDILINNAGITQDAMFHKMTEEQWDRVLKVDLYSVFYLCKAVVPYMREQSYGKIVNITSTSAFGNIGQSNYSSAKAGMIGFSKTLARECGRKNITVNCIAPGWIDTDILKTIPEELMAKNILNIPLGRLGSPDEIASVAAFLSCDDSSFLTGQTLTVSGGINT